jgi:hypothetical protein
MVCRRARAVCHERSGTTDLTPRIQGKVDSQRAMQGIVHDKLVLVIHTGGAYSLFASNGKCSISPRLKSGCRWRDY